MDLLLTVIDQYLGDSDRGEANVGTGGVGQEDTHAYVEMKVTADGQNDEKVPCDGDQVDP
jgi:hypothetical protein